MEKKNHITIKLNDTEDKPQEKRSWDEDFTSYRSPSLPLSHFQRRQRKQGWVKERQWREGTNRKEKYALLQTGSKLLLTIGSAVILGLLMGIMVLSIFSNLKEASSSSPVDGSNSSNGSNSSMEERVGAATLPALEEDAANQVGSQTADQENLQLIPSGIVEGKNVQLPARSYYVIQAGAFSEKEMAQEGLQIYQQLGWSGLLFGETAPYRLYVGISSSKEEAMFLGQFYREKNMEIYVKEHQTAQVFGTVADVKEEALKVLPAFITKGDQLLTSMGEISAKGIMNPSFVLTETEWKELQEQHRSFLQEGQFLFETWPGAGKQAGQSMIRHITAGMNALETYQKQRHESYLWTVQQSALEYIEAYEQFIATIEA